MRKTGDPRYWILNDDHTVRGTDDVHEWGAMFESAGRRVGSDDIDGVYVSTVFLGVNHFYGYGEPMLFETMVSRGPLDGRQWRYATWDEAVAGHARVVAAVKAGIDPDEAIGQMARAIG